MRKEKELKLEKGTNNSEIIINPATQPKPVNTNEVEMKLFQQPQLENDHPKKSEKFGIYINLNCNKYYIFDNLKILKFALCLIFI